MAMVRESGGLGVTSDASRSRSKFLSLSLEGGRRATVSLLRQAAAVAAPHLSRNESMKVLRRGLSR